MSGTELAPHPVSERAVSERALSIPASGIRAVAALAWARPGTVHLELGEPRHTAAEHIVAAADRAVRAGCTHYGPTAGLPEFREAVAEKLVRDNGWADADPDLVVACAGGVGGLFAVFAALLDPGDELLVPDPGWPNFVSICRAVGASPVAYPTGERTGGPPDDATLDELAGPRTRAIVVNSPANPTGAVWTADETRQVVRWAQRRGLRVISDECYDMLGLDGPPSSVHAVAPEAGVVSVFSLSKSYAMTGWRVGYVVSPPPVAAAVTRVLEATASCVQTVGQLAAVAALSGPQDAVVLMRDGYRSTRDRATAECDRLGLTHLRPGGAFYLWLRLPPHVVDTERFARELVERHGVAVAPGTAFGTAGAGHLRVSLAADAADVLTGLAAIGTLAEEQR